MSEEHIYTQNSRDSHADVMERIRDLDQQIASGVTDVTVNGTSTRVDLDQLRKERRQLMQRLPGFRAARPVVASINLGGF